MPPRSEDKTEKPTPKRRREARRKGQVAKSQDLAGWLILFTTAALLPSVVRGGTKRLTGLFAQASNVMANPTNGGALSVLSAGLSDAGYILLPLLPAMLAVGLIGNMVQTRGLFSFGAAAPKFHNLNPATGIKRLFSSQSLIQLTKQVVKLTVLGLMAYSLVSKLGHLLLGARIVAMGPMLSYGATSILTLVRDVAGVGLLLALADYAIAKRQLDKQLKMSRQQVKDEHREAEGDPLIKQKIRRQQFKMSRSRMMAAVLTADVIVTNPTHFAVALKYEAGSSTAPLVVAKGADELALRIREVAQENLIAVVEDPPLARAVYAACEVDQYIPQELFTAVARLLAFVFTLPPTLRNAGLVLRRPSSAMVA